jgi:FAD/FMN-containing dehydrogenase
LPDSKQVYDKSSGIDAGVPMTAAAGVIHDLSAIVGEAGILVSPAETEKYERGYRYGSGRALAIARPATVAELAGLVRYSFAHALRLIPQGANTGLVGASTPDESGEQLVVSLDRLRGVEAVDVRNRTACVRAGTRLSELNREAGRHELFYPIDLGSDPSLGGMVATNTGGSRLVRYGDVQHTLIGLEVVLADADATVLTDLTGLRKDNSGIDLKQLFVGTSGSFGIISRVQVELHRLPRQSAVALVVPTSHAAVPELLALLEAQAGEFLGAFEGMSANAMEAALTHNRRLRNPFSSVELPAYAVLVELTSTIRADLVDLPELLTQLLGRSMEGTDPLVKDACFGRSEDFWAMRHSISDGLRLSGVVIGFDISVPRSRLPELRAELVGLLTEHYPQLRICDFGHCGDGGDHFNLVWPTNAGPYDAAVVDTVRQLVYDRVTRKYGGSFSAEHGVGPHNIAYYKLYASAAERKLAGHLKRLCDPKGILGAVDFS